jgi:RimJ/RimL family protein N-acetyltransferase
MSSDSQNFPDGTEKSFEVGLFRPADAEGVGRLFRSVHGEDYPIKLFYDPQELTRANEQGDYYSVLARSKAGEIIGIHNLFRSAPSRDVYEWGVGLVLKDWRDMKVSRKIVLNMLEKVIPELGMHTVFGEPVTFHVHMQREAAACGFQETALEVGLMPGEAYSGEGVTADRVSTLLCFRCYRNIPQTVYLPAPYNEALRFMYENFSSGRSFHESGAPIPSGAVSKSKMDIFDFAKVARIAFVETGSDFAERLSSLESEAEKKGAIVIQVWVKLTSPWIGEVVRILRTKGYFWGGPLPQWFDDDGLLMQKVFFTPDFESIQLYAERAKRIRDLVKSDWERTQESGRLVSR